MTYFTILHWIILLIIAVLFVVIVILIMQNSDEKFPLPSILTGLLVALLLSALSIYALDIYTKEAKLENVVQKKILINESFSIHGQIRNIGNFTIGKCTLTVNIMNDSFEKSADGAIFRPKSSLDNFFAIFKRDVSLENKIETTQKFVIVQNLHKGEMRNFTVFMRYPPSFVRPYTRYELSCH